MTRAWQMRIPPDAAHVIVDTPAAVPAQDMPDMTKSADAIIVPVLPSDIDIHACSKCIADLLLIAKVRRDEYRIGVVANRVKRNTVIYQSLMRFLETLRIPGHRHLARLAKLCARGGARLGYSRNEALRGGTGFGGLAADAGVAQGQGRQGKRSGALETRHPAGHGLNCARGA